MISLQNIPKINRLISMSDIAEKQFEPVDETLLASVVEDGMYSAEVQIKDKPALESFTAVVAADTSAHETSVETYAEVLGRGMYEQTKFVSGTVVPFIKEIYELVQDKVVGYVPPNFTIEQFFLAEVHDNPSVFDMISEFKAVPHEQTLRIFGYPEYTEQEICLLIQTGSSVIDGLIAKMLAAHDSEWIVGVYQKYFGGNVQGEVALPLAISSLDEYLVAFLLCRKFLQEQPAGVEASYPHIEFEGVLHRLLAQLGTTMHQVHVHWDEFKSQGHLVLNYPTASWVPENEENAIIQVIGDTYDAFLDSGGTPEILIGCAVSDRPYTTAKIVERHQYYAREYNRYCEALDENLARRTAGIVRDATIEAAAERMDALDLTSNENALSKDDYLLKLKAVLAKMDNKDIEENLYCCLRIALCEAFFDDTDALNILVRVDAYMTKYEGMDARKAAYFVCADLIVDHLVQQIKQV